MIKDSILIDEIVVYKATLPLDRPYPLAYATFNEFEAIVIQIRDPDGRSGWGEVTIIHPQYTSRESVESGIAFCLTHAPHLVGKAVTWAKRYLLPFVDGQPHAVSSLMCGLEMLENHPFLHRPQIERVPLLAPVRELQEEAIRAEVDRLKLDGHRTLKIKVGYSSVDEDLARLKLITAAAAGEAKLRIDANQSYTVPEAIRFAQQLNPDVVELFEQPCEKTDWDANAAVARASAVPLMLDESVYTFADIQRAAGIEGVGLIKMEMEKSGGMEMSKAALDHVRACGMIPVAGNGSCSDISSWMEASIACLSVNVASEMHGFLKMKTPLLEEPLPFENGDIVLRPGYFPKVDEAVVSRFTNFRQRFPLQK